MLAICVSLEGLIKCKSNGLRDFFDGLAKGFHLSLVGLKDTGLDVATGLLVEWVCDVLKLAIFALF